MLPFELFTRQSFYRTRKTREEKNKIPSPCTRPHGQVPETKPASCSYHKERRPKRNQITAAFQVKCLFFNNTLFFFLLERRDTCMFSKIEIKTQNRRSRSSGRFIGVQCGATVDECAESSGGGQYPLGRTGVELGWHSVASAVHTLISACT